MVQIQNLHLQDTQTLTEVTRGQRTHSSSAKLSLQRKFFSSVNNPLTEKLNSGE